MPSDYLFGHETFSSDAVQDYVEFNWNRKAMRVSGVWSGFFKVLKGSEIYKIYIYNISKCWLFSIAAVSESYINISLNISSIY